MTITLKQNNNNECIVEFSNSVINSENNRIYKQNIINELVKLKNNGIKVVYADFSDDFEFSSYLGAEVYFWANTIRKLGLNFDYSRNGTEIKSLIGLAFKSGNIPPDIKNDDVSFLENVGIWFITTYKSIKKALLFVRESFNSIFNIIGGSAIYRKKDFWFILEDCSYKAIAIVSLVSFLVGLILAFVGALQLKNFGAQIYVASMVSLGMTRIMSAIMVGIIMAGRTGASYAATIGTMQVNEEIDALKTLGIRISDYLVAPRIIALVISIPFLTMIADVLGILGGSIVGVLFLDISSIAYFDYSIKAINLTNILIGLFHSIIYGIIISICGCYEGLNTNRDADGVGLATTQAVVKSLVWMIVATGILTVILKVLGI